MWLICGRFPHSNSEMNTYFVKLSENHSIKSFSCGKQEKDIDLTDFLMQEAKLYLKQKLGVTYLIESDDDTIAYCTILNDKIERTSISSKFWNKFNKKNIINEKRRKSYPAIKIGCLATNEKYQGQGYARILLSFIKTHLLGDSQFSGCRFITVDAYNDKAVIDSYLHLGFSFIQEDDENDATRCMYIDIMKE